MPDNLMYILVAEDDIDDQELLEQALLALRPDLQLKFITNGNKFRLHLDNLEDDNLPNLILLDYNLPELSGVDILKYLHGKERYKPIPKIVWSTSNSAIFKTQSLEFGAVEYIVKPITIESFVTIAGNLLSYAGKG